MVERMQCNIQSDAITLTTLKYSATVIVRAYIKILTILIFLSQVININLTHENTSLVSPFFFKQNTGNFITETLLSDSHNFNAIGLKQFYKKNLFIVKSSDDN